MEGMAERRHEHEDVAEARDTPTHVQSPQEFAAEVVKRDDFRELLRRLAK